MIKIGKYYITRNNPRKLLKQRADLIDKINKIREYINEHELWYEINNDFVHCKREMLEIVGLNDE